MVSSSFSSDDQFEGVLVRVDLPAGLARETLLAAWDLVEPVCRPAQEDVGAQRRVVEEWTRTRAVTISRDVADAESDLATNTVLDELERYPADCVIRALKAWRTGHKWRPALSEILVEVQWRARYRQCVRAAFERAGVA